MEITVCQGTTVLGMYCNWTGEWYGTGIIEVMFWGNGFTEIKKIYNVNL